MSPEPMHSLAFWASGGSIVGRSGPLGLARATALMDFFNAEAASAEAKGDAAAQRFCLAMAVTLARAILSASAWRRAA